MVVATYWTNQIVKRHNSIHCRSSTRHIPYLKQKKKNVTEQILHIFIHRNFSNNPSKQWLATEMCFLFETPEMQPIVPGWTITRRHSVTNRPMHMVKKW